MTKEIKHPDLNQFIERPETGQVKRHMVAITPEDYEFITDMSHDLATSRNRVISALVAFYKQNTA